MIVQALKCSKFLKDGKYQILARWATEENLSGNGKWYSQFEKECGHFLYI